jgi:hypothetical protein
MIDRFVEARVRKSLRKEKGGTPQPPK